MAQAKHVRISIRAGITGASLTTSTKSIRSTYDAPAARYPARSIPLNLPPPDLLADVTGAHRRTVTGVARRGA